jgi:hypothetical protein
MKVRTVVHGAFDLPGRRMLLEPSQRVRSLGLGRQGLYPRGTSFPRSWPSDRTWPSSSPMYRGSFLLQQPFRHRAHGGYPGEAAEGEHDRQVPLCLEFAQELQDTQGRSAGEGGQVIDDRGAVGGVITRDAMMR